MPLSANVAMSKAKSGRKTSENQIKKPLKLYIVRISPCSRVVWLYMLQVSRAMDKLFYYRSVGSFAHNFEAAF